MLRVSGGACRVVIQGYKKASDAELVGKHGMVQAVEDSGMITLQVDSTREWPGSMAGGAL